MKVYQPGSWVMIGDNVPATVNKVCVFVDGTISYEVVWWIGRERKEIWIFAYELKPHPDSEKMEIGFHKC